ncbi:DASH complex subunit spc19 [Microsporum audouinii]
MASALSSSVSSLRASLQLLESSIDILDEGVNDFPRLCKVLQSTRHFELLPEPTLKEAQQAIVDEITPSISHLITLASNHTDKLARRQEALKAKAELQKGRLYHEPRPSSSGSMHHERKGVYSASMAGGAAGGKAAELRRLTQKKERLQYAVDRLELQSKQRERQLRKSMAAS